MNKDCQSQGRLNGYSYCKDYSGLKAPQNLPKADAYSLLAEVQADMEALVDYVRQIPDDKLQKLADKVSEHFI